MSDIPATVSAAAFGKRPEVNALCRDNLLSVFESTLSPLALVLSLWLIAFQFEGELPAAYLILSVLVLALTFPGQPRLQKSVTDVVIDITFNWVWLAGLLALTGFATGYYREFSKQALLAWLWIAPLSELGTCLLLRVAAPALLRLQGPRKRAIIVGANDQGLALAERLTPAPASRLLGTLDQLAALVHTHQIGLIYLSLPMASQSRILRLLDELKDTTASIYFVPDMFITDLIQGNTGAICGMPVISVCETPFRGANGYLKRLSDVVVSIVILTLISPLMLAIAIALKRGSPGPIIFKQRRYGLDGEEILVYKFRSMSVTADGSAIRQAQKNDARITSLGAFLRRSSMDELPQFVNVIQGRMSIVGPRPHAVAHNELYRKLIKGYMVRHKVKPGITGWAQVNGYRGETDTLDKMQGRIDFDLDYLRNWSLKLNAHIILKTIRLVLKDQKAY